MNNNEGIINKTKEFIRKNYKKVTLGILGFTAMVSLEAQAQARYTPENFKAGKWDKVHELNIQTLKDGMKESGIKKGDKYVKSINFKDGDLNYDMIVSVGEDIIIIEEIKSNNMRNVEVNIDLGGDGKVDAQGYYNESQNNFNGEKGKYEVAKGELNNILNSENPVEELSKLKEFTLQNPDTEENMSISSRAGQIEERNEMGKLVIQNGYQTSVASFLDEVKMMGEKYWEERVKIKGEETRDNSVLFPNVLLDNTVY